MVKISLFFIEFSKQPGAYDSVIVNDDLEKAYTDLKNYLVGSFPALLSNNQVGAGDAPQTQKSTAIDWA